MKCNVLRLTRKPVGFVGVQALVRSLNILLYFSFSLRNQLSMKEDRTVKSEILRHRLAQIKFLDQLFSRVQQLFPRHLRFQEPEVRNLSTAFVPWATIHFFYFVCALNNRKSHNNNNSTCSCFSLF